jgi:high-affinity iron transporter
VRRRILLASVLAGGFALLAAAPAHAADVTPREGVRELDRSRALVDRSLELYAEGDAAAAYEAALSAYLDHFEFVEIPLRVRDEALTLELEEDFANLRNQIEAGTPAETVEATASELMRGLDRVERRLSDPGLAAPLIALGAAFVVLFREGLEAVLVVAAVLGYLEASRNTRYKGAVLRGVAAAGAATLLTFALASFVLRVAPVQRELLEAVTALLAVAVLFYVSFWLVSRLEQRRWMEFVKAKVWVAASTGSTIALAGVGFTAVYREGFETVLFYQALLTFAEGLAAWVAAGAAAGGVVLGGVGYLIFKAGRRLPVKSFLTTAVVMVMALSVAFVGNAVRALQQTAMISVTFLESVPRLPIFLADLTGWHPTRETLLAQAALTLVYVGGALWTFVILPRRARGSSERAPGPEAIPGEGRPVTAPDGGG